MKSANEYINQIIGKFEKCSYDFVESSKIVEDIYNTLTSRRYTYLSRKQNLKYKLDLVRSITKFVDKKLPINCYYDIGGGYHASIYPENNSKLSYEPCLGELLIINQIRMFNDDIKKVYAPGTRFFLIIDNLCANIINKIPIEKTLDYSQSLKNMIFSLGMQKNIELIVESSLFSAEDYAVKTEVCSIVSLKEVENISRFIGHSCSFDEAAKHKSLYQKITKRSEELFNSIIDGIHLTQRATESTSAFRCFPGSDSRMQCGEVVLESSPNLVRPLLLTTANFDNYVMQNSIQIPLLDKHILVVSKKYENLQTIIEQKVDTLLPLINVAQ